MRGDFSRLRYERRDNFNGVLPQQGRLLLDADGIAQTHITNDWQDVAAQDTIGAGVAAVPADRPDSFRIDRARVQAQDVIVTLEPGRVWADGMLLHLEEPAAVDRLATYLQPPIQDPPGTVAGIAAGVRDAVVLELWREALSGFQQPDVLIEPALGGPDTAERVLTASALRLYRLGPEDTCESIRPALADDFAAKGKLKATLQPTQASGGDCPVVEGGGYTGFEHHLYRIEIAETTAGAPSFKWSRFNGGLVGRGVFDAANLRVNITANLAAINTCGLGRFYLEAEEFDAQRGHWRVTYGATVTLNNANQLVLPNAPTFGAIPASSNPVFFRLWDGLGSIAAFPIGANPVELEDGIRLEFEAPATGRYAPRDFWTFPVRADGLGNPPTLVDSQPPQGIHYVRVPLAVVTWNAQRDVTAGQGGISDCRRPFPPLTRLSSCCTYRVGDGKQSHGDFTSVQAAVDALPARGGEVCILPGVYLESVTIEKRENVRLHGCGPRSRIVAPGPREGAAAPAIHVRDSRGIHIEALSAEAQAQGVGVLVDSTGFAPVSGISKEQVQSSHDIELLHLRVAAQERSAIEVRNARFVEIRGCDIRMKDAPGGWPGIFFLGDDGTLEGNRVMVRSARQKEDAGITMPNPASAGLGGIQIGGTSDRVRVVDNLIQGGIGNGITLGSVVVIDADGNDTGIELGWVVNVFDPCNPCKPGTVVFPPPDPDGGAPTRTVSAGALSEIRIERNRIHDMGLNGIGVVAFFDLETVKEIISVEGLAILGNHIRGCLRREIEGIPAGMLDRVGYGGIALADVEALVIWDNVIEDNGPRRTDPVCGVFVLHGEGIDICRNHILNNGARTAEPASSARPGARGGIVVQHAVPPTLSGTAGPITTAPRVIVPSGVPSLRVHDNVVVSPLGRALSATAAGDVSVADNQLTSQAVTPSRLSPSGIFESATVLVDGLGRSPETANGKPGFGDLRAGRYQPVAGFAFANDRFVLRPAASGLAPSAAAAASLLGRGTVLFAGNQVTLDLAEPGASRATVSVVIVSLGDIGFSANQCQARLVEDFLIVNTVLYGFSVHATDNGWQEPVPNTLYSALTLGLMNVTANNVATHCIVARAPVKLLVEGPNVILLSQFMDNPCAVPGRIVSGFGLGVING